MIPSIQLEMDPETGMLIQEQWKDITGYENIYQVSNYGRFKSLARKSSGKINFTINERLLKPSVKSDNGYCCITLSKNTVAKKMYAHRVVGKHFVDNPNSYVEINHKKGIKTRNYAWELEWCSHVDNILHGKVNGLIPSWKGENHRNAKLTLIEVGIIKDAIAAGFKQKDIGRYFNVRQSQVSRIHRNQRWTHGNA